jgi:hypothetical protein
VETLSLTLAAISRIVRRADGGRYDLQDRAWRLRPLMDSMQGYIRAVFHAV